MPADGRKTEFRLRGLRKREDRFSTGLRTIETTLACVVDEDDE